MKRFEILRNAEGGGGGAGGAGEGQGAAAGGAGDGQQAPAGYVNPDGSFAEGWHARPEFAEFKGVERFKSVPDLVKSYRNLETMKGPRAGAVTVPGADATPEEVSAYRKAIGVPDIPTAYDLKPEQIPEGIKFDEGRALKFAERAHKAGMTPAQAREVVAFQLEQEQQVQADMRLQYDNLMAEREQALRKEWGTAYPQKVAVAKQVATALGFDPNDGELFGNPKVLQFLGKVTGLLSEDSVAGMRGSLPASGSGYSSPMEEARAITRDPGHPEHERYMAGDPAVTAKVRRLYNQS
jgi:hypothetical protein